MHLRTYSSSKPCIIRPLFQIIGHLTFLTLSLTAFLIQKIYANIAKFKYFWRTCINKASHNKRSNILHKFLNKMSSQSWGLKSQQSIIWNGGSIYVATWPLNVQHAFSLHAKACHNFSWTAHSISDDASTRWICMYWRQTWIALNLPH